MGFDRRVACSTITLRHLPLPEALEIISALGFTTIDLGALPGVCDHVPFVLDDAAVAQVTAEVRGFPLSVRSINADIGDLNSPVDDAGRMSRDEHLSHLLDLAVAIGAEAIVLPCGRIDHEPVVGLHADLDLVAAELARAADAAEARGVRIWVEAPHFHRLAWTVPLAAELVRRLDGRIGLICDVSHIVASGSTPRRFVELFGPRIAHVHLRDAEPGYINHSIGNGIVDFPDAIAALREHGYSGVFALELETRDLDNDARPAAALAAAEYIGSLIAAAPAAH